jgi:hypothetical protein
MNKEYLQFWKGTYRIAIFFLSLVTWKEKERSMLMLARFPMIQRLNQIGM